jgi:hypothetical protein
MSETDVTIFNVSADEPGGTDVIVQLTGAEARAEASAVSANQTANNIEIILTGASAAAEAGDLTAFGQGTPGTIGFPRTATHRIGVRNYAEDNATGVAQRAAMALHDIAVIGLFGNGPWDTGSNGYLSREEVVADLLARNPDLIIFDYIDLMESDAGIGSTLGNALFLENGPPGAELFWRAGSGENPPNEVGEVVNDWWARDGNGNRVQTFAPSFNTNITDFVVPDPQGRRYPQVFGEFKQETHIDPHLATHGVGIGGINLYIDVFRIQPRSNDADWNGDGVDDEARTNYDPDNPTHAAVQGGLSVASAAAWRAGQAQLVRDLKAANLGITFTVNSTSWSREYTSTNPGDAPAMLTEYVDLVEGGHIQRVTGSVSFPFSGVDNIGRDRSQLDPSDPLFTNFGSWQLMQNAYTYIVNNTINGWAQPEAEIAISQRLAESPQGTNTWDTEPNPNAVAGAYRCFRWTLCSTLMDDGYYVMNAMQVGTTNTGKFGASVLMDEYGVVNTATTGLTRHWLGQPLADAGVITGSPPHEVWYRPFENGAAIVNTSKSNTLNVAVADLGGAGVLKRIDGVQDATTNDGSTVSADFVLQPIDGIVLERI